MSQRHHICKALWHEATESYGLILHDEIAFVYNAPPLFPQTATIHGMMMHVSEGVRKQLQSGEWKLIELEVRWK